MKGIICITLKALALCLFFLFMGIEALNAQCTEADICNGAGSYSCCYGDSQNIICTYCPDNVGDAVEILIFGGELYTGGDFFRVYNGQTADAANLLVEFQGAANLDALTSFISTDPSGCLTVQIQSNFAGSCALSGTGADNPITYDINYICTPPTPEVAISPQPACSADALNFQEITFDASASFSSLGLDITNYQWQFGDNGLGLGAVVTHTYSEPGGYIGTLTVADASGCTASTEFFVEVSGPPFEWAGFGVEEVCPLSELQLSSLVNVPFSWSENFESELIEGPFYPNSPGSPQDQGAFSVTVPIDAPPGIVVADPNEIEVTLNIASSFAGDLQIILSCPDGSQVVLLPYTNSLGTSFLGNPVDGQPLAGSGLDYTFTTDASITLDQTTASNIPSGNYLPEDGDFDSFIGCPIAGNWTVTVIDNLGVDFVVLYDVQLSFGTAGDSPLSESFTCDNANEDIYWLDPEGAIVNDGVFIAPATPGNYTYTAVAPNSCGCEYTQEFEVTVLDPATNEICGCPPSGSFDISAENDGPYCEGEVLQVMAITSETGDVQYSWSGPDNFTSVEQNPIITEAGLYELIIFVDNCPSTTDFTIVEVNNSPVGNAVEVICIGDAFELPNGDIVSPTDDILYTDISTGIMGANNCDSLVNINIIVNSIPTVEVSDVALCQDNNFIDLGLATAIPAGGSWYLGDNSTTGTLIAEENYFQENVQDQQQYYYELADAVGCAGGSVMTVYVGENPAIDFEEVACAGTGEFTFNLFVGQLNGTYDVLIEPEADGFPLNDVAGGVAIPITLPLGESYELTAELTVGAGCQSDSIQVVAPNCGCPIVENPQDISTDFCLQGIADTTNFLDGLTVTNLENYDGYGWFTDETYSVEATNFELEHSGFTNNCEAETATFYLAFFCTNDPSPIPGGTIAINVYPDVSEAEIILEDDGACGPVVASYDCEGNTDYIVSNDYDDNGTTPDYNAETGTGTVVFTLLNASSPEECAVATVEGTYFCVNCPQTNPDDSFSNICDGSAFDYTAFATGLPLENTNGNSIQFFMNVDDPTDPQEEYTGQILNELVEVVCEPAELVLYAYILCDEDADAATPEIWVDLSYTHTLTIYPSELPVIEVEGTCMITTIIPAGCETFITTDPASYEYNPGESGSEEFTATFAYPNDIEGDCAGPTPIPFDYACPANCPTDLIADTEESEVCSGATIELTATVTGDNTLVEYSWTGSDAFVSTEQNPSITLTNDSCEPVTLNYTVTAICTDDGSDVSIAENEITITVYPSNFGFLSTTGENTCTTSILFDAACDLVSVDPEAMQTAINGDGTISHEYTITYDLSGTALSCITDTTISIPVDCPLGCLTSVDNLVNGGITLCDDGALIVNLLDEQESVTTDLDESAVFTWFDENGNEVSGDLTGIPIAHSGSDCAVEIYTYSLEVTCSGDPNFVPLSGGTYTVTLYPTINTDWFTVPSIDGCSAIITGNCTGNLDIQYSLNGTDFSDTAPSDLSPGDSTTFTYQISVEGALAGCELEGVYEIICPLAACPASDFGTAMTENICDNGIPSLPQEGIDYTINDPDNTQFGGIIWYNGLDTDSPIYNEGTPMPFNGDDVCAAGPETLLTAWIECDNNGDGLVDETLQIAEHIVIVYPAITEAILNGPTVDPDDGVCTFIVTTTCPGDVISEPNFTTNPGEEGGTITITVTSGITDGPCPEASFDLAYSTCPSIDCFNSDFQNAATEALCSGETPTLPELGTDFNLTGNLSTQEGDVQWFDGTDPDVNNPYTPISIEVTGCEAGPLTTVYAFVQCNSGGGLSWVQVASHNFQAYPMVESPEIIGPAVQADGSCSFTINPACPNDDLDPINIPDTEAGAAGGEIMVTVTSTIVGSICPSMEFVLNYNECPSADCFSSDFTTVATEVLCSGETPTLPQLGIDFNLVGNVNTQEGDVQWFVGNNPDTDLPYNPETVVVTGCDPSLEETVYAFIQCNDGLTLNWIQVASHSFQAYPNPETPILDGPAMGADGSCSYTINPACEEDVLTVESFTLLPGEEAGNQVVSVSNPNNNCLAIEFILPYSACDNVFDCENANIGDPCDDNDPFTTGDSIEENCECLGCPIIPLLFQEILTATPELPSPAEIYCGTDYEFCIEIINWVEMPLIEASLLAVLPQFIGADFDIDSFQPIGEPTSCDGQGVWTWNDGWYYNAADGGGDDFMNNSCTNYCWQLSTLPCDALVVDLAESGTNDSIPYVGSQVELDILYEIDLNPSGPTPPFSSDCGGDSTSLVPPTPPYTWTVICPDFNENGTSDCEECFDVEFNGPNDGFYCSGETPELPQLGTDIIITEVLVPTFIEGSFGWYMGTNPNTDPPFTGELPFAFCDPNFFTIYAFAQCDSAGIAVWKALADFEITVLPEAGFAFLDGPTIEADGSCSFQVIPECPNDFVSPDNFSVPAGDLGGTVDVTIDGECSSNFISITYSPCPSADCFTANPNPPVLESLCTGMTPTLPSIDLPSILEGDLTTVVDGSFAWFTGLNPDLDGAYVPEPILNINCGVSPINTVYAFVQCSTGGAFTWVQVASHTWEVYPEPQAPSENFFIDPDGTCNFVLTPNCPEDVLDQSGITTFPGDLGGVLEVVVSNGGLCPDAFFSFDYPACDDVFDCPFIGANFGDSCDDGDSLTDGDTITTDCECIGGCPQAIELPLILNNICDQIIPNDTLLFNTSGCDSFQVTIYNTLSSSIGFDTLVSCIQTGNDTAYLTNQVGCDSLLVTTYLSGSNEEVITNLDTCDPSLTNDTLVIPGPACDTIQYTIYNLLPSNFEDIVLQSCELTGTETQNFINVFGCDSIVNITYEPAQTIQLDDVFIDVCDMTLPNDTTFFNTSGCDSFQVNIYNTVSSSIELTTLQSCELTGSDTVFLFTNAGCDSLVITEYEPAEVVELPEMNVLTCEDVFSSDTIFYETSGCDSFQVTNYSPAPEIEIILDSELMFGDCSVGEIIADVSGGSGELSITWSPTNGLTDINADTTEVSEGGIFTITVEDELGCTASASIDVIPVPPPNLSVVPGETINLCPGVTQTVTLSGAETYQWLPNDAAHNGASVDIFGDVNQEYTIIGFDEYDCTDTLILTVIVSNDLDPTVIPDTSVCIGSSIELYASGGTEYTWDGPDLVETDIANPMASPTEPAMYFVTVSNGEGCEATDTILVDINDVPEIQSFSENMGCFNQELNLSGITDDNTQSIAWSGGSGTFSNANGETTTYMPGPNDGLNTELTLTGSNECGEVSIPVELSIIEQQNLSLNSDYFEFCEGEEINLTVGTSSITNFVESLSNQGTYTEVNGQWSIEGNNTIGSAEYYLTIQTECEVLSDTLTVIVNPISEITSIEDASINLGESILLEAYGDTSNNYQWTILESLDEFAEQSLTCFNCPNPEASPTATTTYMVTSNTDCATSDNVTITVSNESSTKFPNAFSPNGDGMNDYFKAFGSNFEVDQLVIFNRYGDLLYQGTGNEGWDGYYNGEPQEIGVYLFVVEYHSTIDGIVEKLTGNLTLIR